MPRDAALVLPLPRNFCRRAGAGGATMLLRAASARLRSGQIDPTRRRLLCQRPQLMPFQREGVARLVEGLVQRAYPLEGSEEVEVRGAGTFGAHEQVDVPEAEEP